MESFKELFDKVLLDMLAVSPLQITPDARFIEDLGADSLAMVELIMEFEKVFNISVPDEDFPRIKTVADAENCVERLSKTRVLSAN